MHPFAFNPDVGLIHPPTVVGWFESPTQTLFHFRAIALDPPPDGDVIGAQAPRSASNSSTSRYEREKRKYHPTASRMTSGSNCRHLNKPQPEEARRSIRPAYHGLSAKLQHFLFVQLLERRTGLADGKNGEILLPFPVFHMPYFRVGVVRIKVKFHGVFVEPRTGCAF